MIPRLKLPAKLRAELTAIRAALAAQLALAIKQDGLRSALQAESGKLQSAIERLETGELSDGNAQKLAMKREKLRQVAARLAAANDRPASDESQAELCALLREFRPLLLRAMAPVQQAISDAIERAMAPFFDNLTLLNQIVPQSVPMQVLSNFNARQWGLNAQSVCSQGKDAIKIIDTLLAGKNPIKL